MVDELMGIMQSHHLLRGQWGNEMLPVLGNSESTGCKILLGLLLAENLCLFLSRYMSSELNLSNKQSFVDLLAEGEAGQL